MTRTNVMPFPTSAIPAGNPTPLQVFFHAFGVPRPMPVFLRSRDCERLVEITLWGRRGCESIEMTLIQPNVKVTEPRITLTAQQVRASDGYKILVMHYHTLLRTKTWAEMADALLHRPKANLVEPLLCLLRQAGGVPEDQGDFTVVGT